MCLSSVYFLGQGEDKKLICKNIASVESKDSQLIFKNIMGIPTIVSGEISHIDFVDNCIYVRQSDSFM